MSKTKFPTLKAELRQRELHSKSIHKRIRETSGEERMRLWEEKRAYGAGTRCVLLLYAMARGMPRSACEPQHRDDAWILPQSIVAQAERLGVELGHDIREARRKAVSEWLKATQQPASGAVGGQAVPDSPS